MIFLYKEINWDLNLGFLQNYIINILQKFHISLCSLMAINSFQSIKNNK